MSYFMIGYTYNLSVRWG